MADPPENSGPYRPSPEAESAAPDSSIDFEPSDVDLERHRNKKYGKRGRHRTHRYEALRRSQAQLGWALATGTLAGIGLGLLFGNLFVGTGIGLTLGLAIGLLISG